jgi:hypothetical protein
MKRKRKKIYCVKAKQSKIKIESHILINCNKSQQIANSENLIKKRQQEAEAKRKIILKLNTK